MTKNKRVNILDAWIQVEHLSEGNFNAREKGIIKLEGLNLQDDIYDFHSFFLDKMKDTTHSKCGIVLYLDIFKFDDVLKILQTKFKFESTEEEILKSKKFSMALCFRKETIESKDKSNEFVEYFKFDVEKFFFTTSGYIRYDLGNLSKFYDFEEEYKKDLNAKFEDADSDIHKFNKAVMSIFQEYNIEIRNCYYKKVHNITSSFDNLHSFFIADLQKAKKETSPNLDRYLNDFDEKLKRINLDSKDSDNNSIFEKILQPINYPLARFPSNINFKLSFMQQVAVNLVLNDSTNHLRSGNGPPGTGKTTLLKDIFADMIVQQSSSICTLKDKVIRGKDLRYFNNAMIGSMPSNIADKGILVASSNNGAVQNIVNELPLFSGIDVELIEEIKEADYFLEIANSKVSENWESGKKEIQCQPRIDANKNWGVLSLEGGTSTNMGIILNIIELMVKYLNSDKYVENSNIYNEFETLRKKVAKLRALSQQYFNELEQYKSNKIKHIELTNQSECIRINKIDKLNMLETEIERNKNELKVTEKNLRELEMEYEDVKDRYASEDKSVDYLMRNKPFFLSFKARKEYAYKLAITEDKRKEVLKNKNLINDSLKIYKSKEKSKKNKINELNNALIYHKNEFENQKRQNEQEIEKIKKIIIALEEKFTKYKITPLNMSMDYDTLQLSTPWFDKEYRMAQSQLFIMSLKVRKQFLYENKNNMKASIAIWRKQEVQLSKHNGKQLIQEAWNWINMCIPIISTTFSSLGRMTKNLGIESIANLFVDEAGQALPQACVGGILRSKNILVVGDPCQIKPVLTLDPKMLSKLAKHYEITEKYLSVNASIQTIVDDINKYGYWKSQDEWIGIPLWVHRRCQYPMFDISNKISYNDNMVQVQDKEVNGKAFWYDIKGSATNKYVKEQGEFLVDKIKELLSGNPCLKDEIYVISPFSNVAKNLAEKLGEIKFTKYEEGSKKATNVGTVHTFQGKEADIVFFVLGADEKSKCAASWAVTEANIMNVAVTRAKKEFYIIGDKTLYKNLKTPVIDSTINIIDYYNKVTSNVIFDTKSRK